MKTHILIADSGYLKWLACRTTSNDDIDAIELNDIVGFGIPPAVDCANCLEWIKAEARRRATKLPTWR